MTSQEKLRNNLSLNSTHHMSCNQSHTTNFYPDKKLNIVSSYAHIPMKKQTPRWNQSASTWRHSTKKYSFSQDQRFKNSSFYYTDIIQPEIPSTLSNKSCTLGKDRKKPISLVVLRNAKEKPAPDRYDHSNIDEETRNKSKGKTFGISWKHYEKVYLKHRSDVYSAFQNEDNPPAKYQVRQTPGGNKNKYTAYGRLKMFTQKMSDDKNWVPGPHHEIKDRHLYGTVGMNDRNFAFGERIDLSKPANLYPQAIYDIPGFCRKFSQISRKNQKVNSQKPLTAR